MEMNLRYEWIQFANFNQTFPETQNKQLPGTETKHLACHWQGLPGTFHCMADSEWGTFHGDNGCVVTVRHDEIY